MVRTRDLSALLAVLALLCACPLPGLAHPSGKHAPRKPLKPAPEVQKLLDEAATILAADPALVLQRKALARARELKDAAGVAASLQAVAATRTWGLGEGLRALPACQEALDACKALGDVSGQAEMVSLFAGINGFAAGGDRQRAHRQAEQALALFRSAGNRGGEGGILDMLGGIHDVIGEPEEARRLRDQAVRILRPLNQPYRLAWPLKGLGVYWFGKGDHARARAYLAEAASLFARIGRPDVQADTLGVLADVELAAKQPAEAVSKLEKALDLRRSLKDAAGEGAVLGKLVAACTAALGPQRAAAVCSQAAAASHAAGDTVGEARAHISLAGVRLGLKQTQEGLAAAELALTLSIQAHDRPCQLNALQVAVGSADRSAAMPFLRTAAETASRAGADYAQAEALANLGCLLQAEPARLKEAVQCHEQALECYRAGLRKDPEAADIAAGEAYDLQHLGEDWMALGEVGKGLDAYRRAMAAFRAMGNTDGECACMASAVSACQARGVTEKGQEFALGVVAEHEDAGDRAGGAALLSALGDQQRNAKQYREAAWYYERAAAVYRRAGDRRGEGYACQQLSLALCWAGDTVAAVPLMKRAALLYRQVADKAGEGVSWAHYGNMLADKRLALEPHRRALALQRQAHDAGGEAGTLYALAQDCDSLNDLPAALEYGRRSAAAFSILKDANGLRGAFGLVCRAAARTGRPSAADEALRQLMGLCLGSGDRAAAAGALVALANQLYEAHLYAQAVEAAQAALPVCRAAGDKSREAWALYWVGESSRCLGQHARAIQYLDRALPFFRQLGDRWGEGFALVQHAQSLIAAGKLREALPRARQALGAFRAEGKAEQVGGVKGIVGDALAKGTNGTVDTRAVDEWLAACRADGGAKAEAEAASDLGWKLRGAARWPEALRCADRAMASGREAGDAITQSHGAFIGADALLAMGEPGKAVERLRLAVNLYQATGRRDMVAESLALASVAAERAGDARASWQLTRAAWPVWRELKRDDRVSAAIQSLVAQCAASGPDNEARLQRELLAEARAAGGRESEARVSSALFGSALARGVEAERRTVESLLSDARAAGGAQAEAAALLGFSASSQGWRGVPYAERALAISRAAKNPAGEAAALFRLGECYQATASHEKAVELLLQAAPYYRRAREPATLARLLTDVALELLEMGETRRALEAEEEALPAARAAGDRELEAKGLGLALQWCRAIREPARAEKQIAASIRPYRAKHDTKGEAQLLESLSAELCGAELGEEGAGWYLRAAALRRSAGDASGEALALMHAADAWTFSSVHPEKGLVYLTRAAAGFRSLGDASGEAHVELRCGEKLLVSGRPKEALPYFRRAMAVSRRANLQVVEGNCLVRMAQVYNALGQPGKALEPAARGIIAFAGFADGNGVRWGGNSLERAVARSKAPEQALRVVDAITRELAAKGDHAAEAALLCKAADAAAAVDTGEMVAQLRERAAALKATAGDRATAGELLQSAVEWWVKAGKRERARQATALIEQLAAKARASGDHRAEGEAHRRVANAYNALGETDRALACWQEAAAISRAAGDLPAEGKALANIANTYQERGETEKALACYEQVMARMQQSGGLSASGDIVDKLNGYACFYMGQGQHEKALGYLLDAIRLTEEDPQSISKWRVRYNTGVLYMYLGQPQKALRYLQMAHQAWNDRAARAGALMFSGRAYLELGDTQKAIRSLQEALQAGREARNEWVQAVARRFLADAYRTAGHPSRAIALFVKEVPASALRGPRAAKLVDARSLVAVGRAYADAGDLRNALACIERSMAPGADPLERQEKADALIALGDVQEALGRLADADRSLKEGLELLESIRGALGGMTELKTSFMSLAVGGYRGRTNVLLRLSKSNEAFELSQQTKARALLDLMAEARLQPGPGLTEEERRQERELRSKAAALNQQMVAEGVRNQKGSKARYLALKQQLEQAERDLSTFTDSLYARHPGLAQQRAARTATLAELGATLPADTALLEYATVCERTGKKVADRLALFVVSPSGGKPSVSVERLPVGADDAARRCARFRLLCAKPRADYQKEARELYRLLVKPAEGALAGFRRLVICPDGPLWDVPFGALLDARGRTLLERYELVQAYSATGAQAALAARTQANRPQPTGTLLALAAPDFGGDERFGPKGEPAGSRPVPGVSRPVPGISRPIPGVSRPIDSPSRPIETPSRLAAEVCLRGAKLAPLPGARREAETIRRDFPGALVLTGKEAQEATLKQQIGKYRYLHFATHGFFNDAAPLLSSLVLADPPRQGPGSEEDGFLTARELFDMDLSAEMAVLSACNTARGEKRSGEGIIGLTWALFAAGVPTQVLAQWAVDDAATAELMERFYAGVKAGKGKAAALREAALALKNDGKHAHPYYWAPFVLMGDWR